VGLLLFAVGVVATGWAVLMIAVSIVNAMNPLVYILLSIALLVAVAWLGQYVARQGEVAHH